MTTDVLVWIGLEYHRYSNESVYSWRDDSSVKLRKFENDRIHTPDDCFSMSTTTGQWTAADNCSEQYLYACSKPKTYTEVLAQRKFNLEVSFVQEMNIFPSFRVTKCPEKKL